MRAAARIRRAWRGGFSEIAAFDRLTFLRVCFAAFFCCLLFFIAAAPRVMTPAQRAAFEDAKTPPRRGKTQFLARIGRFFEDFAKIA